MTYPLHPAIKALILHQGKILILKVTLGDRVFWELPGGKVEYGENPYDTLHREVQEEVSLEIDIIKPLGLWWFIRKNDQHQVVCTTFLCTPKTTDVDIHSNPVPEAITDYAWVTPQNFLTDQYLANDTLKQLIRDHLHELQ